jgi:hypothetical protein
MHSINRRLLFPITHLFALALVLPLGCGSGSRTNNDPLNNGSNSDDAFSCDDSDPSNDPDAGHKVTICHFPPGNPANAHTIRVGAPAVPAHLAHGDHLGPCGPGEGRCGHDGGQQDAGNPPDGGQGGDGGTCLPQNAHCDASTPPCCSGLICVSNVCARPLP